jgi:glycosyltransferase involved in cell wall biosynthesis
MDISQLERSRANTGIQRVVKEFLQRAVNDDSSATYKILAYNKKIKKMQQFSNEEVKLFCDDVSNYKFKSRKTINIETLKPQNISIFFDIDSAWNAPYKREKLYPILKRNGFYIFNFIHDLIPVLLSKYVQEVTIKNYKPFIETVYRYSDVVLFNSTASKNDFLSYKKRFNIQRDITTKVIGLGCDFLSTKIVVEDELLKSVLSKKYILFVGTIEPRKNHEEVLEAYDRLSHKYSDLNLVFIGMKGWKNDEFIQRIENHHLKDERFFWFNNIDDDTLYHFYENAFIVTYLSKYEGYGLPIVEALQHGNVTITSNNSSMPEVGRDYADYVDDGNLDQLVGIIKSYLDDDKKHQSKRDYIKSFKPMSWDLFSQLIFKENNDFYKRKNREGKFLINNIKNKIKSIPLIGWFIRFIYNLIRLNNIKHTLFQQQKQIKAQKRQIDQQAKDIKKLQSILSKEIDKRVATQVAKQITFHTDAFSQRLDQYIFDSKIESKKRDDISE